MADSIQMLRRCGRSAHWQNTSKGGVFGRLEVVKPAEEGDREEGMTLLDCSLIVYALLMARSQKRRVPKAQVGASQRTGPRRAVPPTAKAIPSEESRQPDP